MLQIEVFVLPPLSTNCYVIYNSDTNNACIIDPASPSNLVLDFVKEKNLNVNFIINTHFHFDHVGGDNYFSKNLNCKIYMHELDKNILYKADFSDFLSEPDQFDLPTGVLSIKNEIVKVDSELEFEIIHTPGHSPGSISLYNRKSRVIFSGDTLFKNGFGRVDLPGGDFNQIVTSIKQKLFKLEKDVKVYPGHGEDTTIGEEIKSNPINFM